MRMNWTDEEYYNDTEYFSVSAFKKFNRCELDGLTGVYNGKSSVAMLVGSYCDSYVEGTLYKFKENHPEIISSRGSTKGMLKSEFVKADEICKFIDSDKTIQDFLSGEKQTVFTGEIVNVPFKIKMDSYSPSIAIVDLKIMATITDYDGKYIDFISKYGYDTQLSVYQNIVFQNTGEKLPCFIAVVTKETPINSAIIQIPQEVMDKALYRVQENIKHLYEVKTGVISAVGCGKCKSCISTRKTTPLICMEELMISC